IWQALLTATWQRKAVKKIIAVGLMPSLRSSIPRDTDHGFASGGQQTTKPHMPLILTQEAQSTLLDPTQITTSYLSMVSLLTVKTMDIQRLSVTNKAINI
ncbi:MAG: hypothetical protein EBZ77_18065, partial [Chitinophagia bacterium]|nr:hypothetical protein [Chitinophagia bacterium]